MKSLIGLLGGSKAGVLPHRPIAAAIHGRLHAARIRIDAGESDARLGLWSRIERLDGNSAAGLKQRLAQRARLRGALRIDLGEPLLQRGHDRTPSAQKIPYQNAAPGSVAHWRSRASASSNSAAPSSPPPTIGSRAPASSPDMFSIKPGNVASPPQAPK